MGESDLSEKKYKLHLLQQDSIKILYNKRLDLELKKYEISENIEIEYDNITRAIDSAAAQALGLLIGEKENLSIDGTVHYTFKHFCRKQT